MNKNFDFIDFIGSHEDVHHQTANVDTAQIICQKHEDCEARSCDIKPIKGFQAKEQVKGHTVSSENRFFFLIFGFDIDHLI